MKFRPRFSVRTLAIVVTLACAYFGAWEATNRYAAREKTRGAPIVLATRAIAPLLISRDTLVLSPNANSSYNGTVTAASFKVSNARTHYYVWFLGPMVKLPYESNADPYTLTNVRIMIKSGELEILYQECVPD